MLRCPYIMFASALLYLVLLTAPPCETPTTAAKPHVPAPPSSNQTGGHSQNTEHEKTYWKHVTAPDVLPVWLTFFATFGTALVAGCTLVPIARQTKIAANSARAWIGPDVTFIPRLPDYARQGLPEISCMVVEYKNYGASPTEILKGEVMAVLIDGEPLKDDPPYLGNGVYAIASEFIAPGGSRRAVVPIEFHPRLTEADLKAVNERRMFLYCYGYVTYKDNSGKQRKTQFGYRWYTRSGPDDTNPEAMYRMESRKYNYIK